MTEDQNVRKVREEGLDKFYTNPDYAKKCIDKVFEIYPKNRFNLIIEPSAGNGSFFNHLDKDKRIGLDILPENENVIEMDFFEFTPMKDKVLVIGNPPFGKVSSLAVKFFNHSAKWADVIAFIIPRTFRKPSIQNKLKNTFHLVHDEDVPMKPCCFAPNMTAKCCFQIWEKKNITREKTLLIKTHDDWEFIPYGPKDDRGQPTVPKGADFAMRAYGGKIGEIKLILDDLRPKSWHFIKSKINKQELINRFNKLDYSGSLNTARQNSMGRGELVMLYNNSK